MASQSPVELFWRLDGTQEERIDVAHLTQKQSVTKSIYNTEKLSNKIAISKSISNEQWCSVQEFISLVNSGVIQIFSSGENVNKDEFSSINAELNIFIDQKQNPKMDDLAAIATKPENQPH